MGPDRSQPVYLSPLQAAAQPSSSASAGIAAIALCKQRCLSTAIAPVPDSLALPAPFAQQNTAPRPESPLRVGTMWSHTLSLCARLAASRSEVPFLLDYAMRHIVLCKRLLLCAALGRVAAPRLNRARHRYAASMHDNLPYHRSIALLESHASSPGLWVVSSVVLLPN